MIQGLKKYSQLQIGLDIWVELQIPPSPNVDLTTPRWGGEGYSYYLCLVNKQIIRTIRGFDKFSKYTNNYNETYKFWWRNFMGQFTN